MLRSQPWSDRSSRPKLWPLWLAGAAVGIVAEWSLYGWSRPGGWLPDLFTGWCLVGCGLAGWSLRPESWSGALLAATGFAWFAPNLATIGTGGADWLSAHALYLHRAPLAALVLTYPRGRRAGRLEATVIAALSFVALITPVWRDDVAAIALATGMIVVAAHGYLRAVGRQRRMLLFALRATVLVGATIAAVAAVRLAAPGHAAATVTLRGYEAMLCILSIGLLIGLLRAPWQRSAVTDLVVELGETRSGTLRDELARALGDPSLDLGIWLPDAGAYVDSQGRALRLPGEGSPRSVTRIDREGQPMAVLIHDPAVLGDQALIEAVASAAKLAAANARLHAQVRASLAEIGASRRRLVEAGDEERDRLERRLREGAQRRLDDLAELLHQAREIAAETATVESIDKSDAQLARTNEDLRRLARGIHPRELSEGGLAAALSKLATEFPLPVALTVARIDPDPSVEACAYFVCSVALANVAKHAGASAVRISVRSTCPVP